jgi:LysM repeat protein
MEQLSLFKKLRVLPLFLIIILSSFFFSSCVSVRTTPSVDYPSSTPSPPPRPTVTRGYKTHTVAPGETLWRIAKVYDVPLASITRANRLSSNQDLQLGQKLDIPYAKEPQQIISLFPSNKWKYIIIHHSATDEGSSLQFHKHHQNKGWKSVGYHFVIDNGESEKPDGFIEITPRWLKQENGAHCKASHMNNKSIGICLVGNFNKTELTKAQMDSLVYLVNKLRLYYKIPMKRILKHGQVRGSNTDCPGKKFPWYWFKKRLKES